MNPLEARSPLPGSPETDTPPLLRKRFGLAFPGFGFPRFPLPWLPSFLLVTGPGHDYRPLRFNRRSRVTTNWIVPTSPQPTIAGAAGSFYCGWLRFSVRQTQLSFGGLIISKWEPGKSISSPDFKPIHPTYSSFVQSRYGN